MALTIPYQEPVALLASTEQELESTAFVKLFNDSHYQKLTERWCAALFGLGYSQFVAPCKVAVNEGRYREDVDLYLRAAEHDWEFQLAEVQAPVRRRGLEYKQFARGTVRTTAYDAERGRRGRRGRREGPGWLAEGVERKKAKRYASSHALHLLLYANFPARDLQYTDVVAALAGFVDDFASLWVVTSLHLCSVFSSAGLGEVKGWGPIRSIEDYYA